MNRSRILQTRSTSSNLFFYCFGAAGRVQVRGVNRGVFSLSISTPLLHPVLSFRARQLQRVQFSCVPDGGCARVSPFVCEVAEATSLYRGPWLWFWVALKHLELHADQTVNPCLRSGLLASKKIVLWHGLFCELFILMPVHGFGLYLSFVVVEVRYWVYSFCMPQKDCLKSYGHEERLQELQWYAAL